MARADRKTMEIPAEPGAIARIGRRFMRPRAMRSIR